MEETVLNEAEHFVAFDWESDDGYNINLSLEERKRNSVNKLLEWEDRILEVRRLKKNRILNNAMCFSFTNTLLLGFGLGSSCSDCVRMAYALFPKRRPY